MISVFFRTLCNSGIFSTLLHRKPEHILKLNYIQKPVKYIRWSILFRTLLNYEIFKPLIHLKPQHIQNSRTQNTELKILWISRVQFTANPIQNPIRHVWWVISYRTLCNTGIFRSRGIFLTLPMMENFIQNHM